MLPLVFNTIVWLLSQRARPGREQDSRSTGWWRTDIVIAAHTLEWQWVNSSPRCKKPGSEAEIVQIPPASMQRKKRAVHRSAPGGMALPCEVSI